jgi:uncharacterized BrkB/YihY/UPF0761 family membrane protein
VDRALEAVEDVRLPADDNLERLVVLVPADLARGHVERVPGPRPGQTRQLVPQTSTVERVRTWGEALRERMRRLAERAEAERGRRRSVAFGFELVNRDSEVGGGILAGALAYRFFIWMLPLALVAVAGLGFAAESAEETPEETAESVGLGGLISSSIAGAAESPNRWYALLIGIPVLLWTTRSLLRALIGAHRLVWFDIRARAPRPTAVASLRLLALLLALLVVAGTVNAVRDWLGGIGVIATFVIAVPYAAVWLLVSLRLPHRDAPVTALIPGALLFGIGLELLHIGAALLLVPYAIDKQGTYGALGAAAALLFGLFLACRLIVGAAEVNATHWEAREGRERPARDVG